MARCDALVCLDNNLTRRGLQIKIKLLSSQSLSDQIHLCRLRQQRDTIIFKEQAQNLFCRVIQRFEDNRCRKFAASVNSDKQEVFLIKFKI